MEMSSSTTNNRIGDSCPSKTLHLQMGCRKQDHRNLPKPTEPAFTADARSCPRARECRSCNHLACLVLGFLPKERAEIRREVRTDSRTTLSEWRRRFLEDLAEVRQLRYFDPANDPRHGKEARRCTAGSRRRWAGVWRPLVLVGFGGSDREGVMS